MSEEVTPLRVHDHFNPVTVMAENTAGTVFLGILALVLLLALLRAQGRNRKLLRELAG